MATPASGWDSFFAVGNESTWGTAVARTKFFEHAGISPNFSWPEIEFPAFRARSSRGHGRGLNTPDLEVSMPGNYTGMEFLWLHLFGVAPTTTTAAGGTLAMEHTFTFSDSAATLEGLTGEIRYGYGSSLVKAYSIEGLKVTGVTIDFQEDRSVDFTWRFSGEQVQPLGSPTSATYPTRVPMWWNHVVAKKATTAFDFRSATVDIDLGYNTNRRKMGSYLRKEPVPGPRRTATIRLATDFEDPTLLHDLLQGTTTTPAESALRLQIQTLDSNANGIETGQAYEMNLDFPACYVRSSNLPIGDGDIVPNEVELVAEYDVSGGAEMLTCLLRNAVTSVP